MAERGSGANSGGRPLFAMANAFGRRYRSLLSFGAMRGKLTSFQVEVEKVVNDVLAHVGKRVVDRRIDGIAETYVTGCVANQDITFWIYSDGAALQVGRRHRAFGFPTHESLVDTAREFLDEFIRAVGEPDAAARN
jgi:hypothetical protein